MELLTMIFGLPFAPIRGLIKLGELVQEQADLETRHPAAVRRRLEEIEEARLSGEITEEEEAEAVEQVLGQMTAQQDLPGMAMPGRGEEDEEG
ncbi:gas vesicle protein GvpG [Streptosporangium sp. NPDC087985]|uniref:gas vesicle protein GvpG n=1 Tax=Streptosporangium sp. NPDC087985 TaxID=3366196 RepID=UPI00381DEEC4